LEVDYGKKRRQGEEGNRNCRDGRNIGTERVRHKCTEAHARRWEKGRGMVKK